VSCLCGHQVNDHPGYGDGDGYHGTESACVKCACPFMLGESAEKYSAMGKTWLRQWLAKGGVRAFTDALAAAIEDDADAHERYMDSKAEERTYAS